jgi:hypothetical protein
MSTGRPQLALDLRERRLVSLVLRVALVAHPVDVARLFLTEQAQKRRVHQVTLHACRGGPVLEHGTGADSRQRIAASRLRGLRIHATEADRGHLKNQPALQSP